MAVARFCETNTKISLLGKNFVIASRIVDTMGKPIRISRDVKNCWDTAFMGGNYSEPGRQFWGLLWLL